MQYRVIETHRFMSCALFQAGGACNEISLCFKGNMLPINNQHVSDNQFHNTCRQS